MGSSFNMQNGLFNSLEPKEQSATAVPKVNNQSLNVHTYLLWYVGLCLVYICGHWIGLSPLLNLVGNLTTK